MFEKIRYVKTKNMKSQLTKYQCVIYKSNYEKYEVDQVIVYKLKNAI